MCPFLTPSETGGGYSGELVPPKGAPFAKANKYHFRKNDVRQRGFGGCATDKHVCYASRRMAGCIYKQYACLLPKE